MPGAQDRAEQHEVDQMVAGLNRPDFKAMPGKQLIDQVGGRDETQPDQETGRRARCGP